MSNLACPVCRAQAVEPQVRIVYRTSVLGVFQSFLKAEDYAIKNINKPGFSGSVFKYINVCGKCGNEEVKLERLFSSRLF
jgi:hypothetical protein